ncbi:MAG: plasmid stabilization protein [Brachymonas sp.]|nr:plasmid stabilization protein [Brachymonas sp.]
MHTLTIRRVPDQLHHSLKMRAAAHGRSAEAEVREILQSTLAKQQPHWLDQLRQAGLELEKITQGKAWLPSRSKRPFTGADFSE